MADPREYDEAGDVTGGYLTPEEAREQGVEWKGRPGESDDLSSPDHYQTEDEANALGRAYNPVERQYDYGKGGFGNEGFVHQPGGARVAMRGVGGSPSRQPSTESAGLWPSVEDILGGGQAAPQGGEMLPPDYQAQEGPWSENYPGKPDVGEGLGTLEELLAKLGQRTP